MIATMKTAPSPQQFDDFATSSERWQAVVTRDPQADGRFVYAVKTTGVYCRPWCKSRRPRRENVLFFASPLHAEAAGFRPCRKCRPRESWSPQQELIVRACRHIESADVRPTLSETAAKVGLSPSHFHRLFSRTMGVTPKQFGDFVRHRRLRSQLNGRRSITAAIFASGFESNSRCYAGTEESLGMSPGRFRDGGRGLKIQYAVTQCRLGRLLVAATDIGLCMIEFGDSADELRQRVEMRFHGATLRGSDRWFRDHVRQVVAYVDRPRLGLDLPLDIQGTAFQCRVWQALRSIPAGKTATYREIARRIGSPQAVRAVAGACAANTLAVAVPCHRVVRTGGDAGGYKWGKQRKAALLAQEKVESNERRRKV
jgi:AraC family transcriptional regulator of adaptative response/methylated-DNA-[protein]-cysteine methyltransferase